MSRPLRIAVAGAGPRANDYMATIVKLSDIYRFCAVCDRDEERGRRAVAEHGAGHSIRTLMRCSGTKSLTYSLDLRPLTLLLS